MRKAPSFKKPKKGSVTSALKSRLSKHSKAKSASSQKTLKGLRK